MAHVLEPAVYPAAAAPWHGVTAEVAAEIARQGRHAAAQERRRLARKWAPRQLGQAHPRPPEAV